MASVGYLYSYSIICLILYGCQFTLVVSVPVEPVCSKFSYDEQLLEKMVRIEFFVENMKKDVDTSVSNFEDKLNDIQANNSNTFSEQQEKINNLELQTGNLEVQTGVFADTMANKSTVSETTENLKNIMDNIKKDLADNVTDLKENDAKLSNRLSEQQKHFESKMDILGDTKANKSTVIDNTKNLMNIMDNIKKDLEDNVTDLKENDDKLSNRLSEQQKHFESKMDILGDTKANKSTVSENTNNYMNMKAVMENIKQDLKESSSSVDDLKVATDEINTKCKNELSDLSKKVTELEKQIKDLNLASKSMVVAFNVMDAVRVISGNAIKFSNIILNEGDAYNKDTGIFTAPTDGIYQFNAHICCPKEKEIDYYITVNGNWIVTGEFRVPDGASDNKCTSFSAVALVRKGENVRVGGMTTADVNDGSDDLCSFSGTLIQSL